MLLIVKGLEYIGFNSQEIIIRLCDVEIFNRLSDRCQLKSIDRVAIKEFLDKIAEERARNDRNSENKLKQNLIRFLDQLQIPKEFKDFWLLLSEKDGLKSLPTYLSQPTLSYLESLCYELNNHFNVRVQIDSSVVRSHEYYTGTVFEVDYLQNRQIHVEIAGGGRYNKLLRKFTDGQIPDIPATGFAYGVQRLASIWKGLDRRKIIDEIKFFLDKNSEDIIIASKNNNYYNAFIEAEKIRKSGKRVSIWLDDYNKFVVKIQSNIMEVE